MNSGTVYGAVREDERTVLDVLTEAFMDDPVVCWLFPDEHDRRRVQPHFYGPLLTQSTAEAHLTGEHGGAAIWLSLAAGRTPYEETGPLDVFGESGARLRALGEVLVRRHPYDEAHLYLPCMGVVAARQGTGLGSALLRHRLARADADRLPAYLEASSPRSRDLYLRHGFADLDEPVSMPGGPTLWPMWRHPKENGEQKCD
jgi:GNAT superfamily N-acetyltransferase